MGGVRMGGKVRGLVKGHIHIHSHKGNGWYRLLSDAFATIPFWHFLGF